MKETTKANKRRVKDSIFQLAFSGNGIDVGGGNDALAPTKDFPNILSVKNFDSDIGDAQYILEYEKPESYDFLYSSHCLEHMLDPYFTLQSWGKLVKPGGYLTFVVPDEDLYEQGTFPSRWNAAHAFTFTIMKHKSWSLWSINIVDLINVSLPPQEWETMRLGLHCSGYDFKQISVGVDQTKDDVEANIEVMLRKR